MKNTKYSVLFMRDDRPVKRYRMSPFWIKLIIYTFFFMLIAAGGGSYVGITFFKSNKQLIVENKRLERRVIEAQVKLEQLQNVEQILSNNDPKELQALFGSVNIEQPAPVPQPDPIDLSDIFLLKDTHQAGVENLQIKLKNDTVQVRFDLNNMQSVDSLSGEIGIELVSRSGEVQEAKTNRKDLIFSIQRFKRIMTSFTLPDSIPGRELFGIRLTITSPDGKTIFSETYPLYNIIS